MPPFDKVKPALERNDSFTVSASSITKIINGWLAAWDKHSPDTCVLISTPNSDPQLTLEGRKLLKLFEKSGLNSVEPGKIFIKKLTDDLVVLEDVVENLPEFREKWGLKAEGHDLAQKALVVWYESMFNAAATVSSLGVEFTTNSFRYDYSGEWPEWTAVSWVPYNEASFKEQCIQRILSEEESARLSRLSYEYQNAFPLGLWENRYSERIKNCQKGVQSICGNTYTVKGTRILSYPTVGCEIRDVTENDIRNDMRSFSTEADRLQHSTFVDTIDLCDRAESAGFTAYYSRPVLSGECAEKKPKAPK